MNSEKLPVFKILQMKIQETIKFLKNWCESITTNQAQVFKSLQKLEEKFNCNREHKNKHKLKQPKPD